MSSDTEPPPGASGAPGHTPALRLKVKTLEPATYELAVTPQLTVQELKTRLEGLARDAPAARQRVIFRGRPLQDGSTLQQLGITDGDTVHMVVRPADAPAPTPASGPGGTGAFPGQSRLEQDTSRILDQINQMLNLNLNLNVMGMGMGMPFNMGPGGQGGQPQQPAGAEPGGQPQQPGSDARNPEPGQGPRQPAAPETPHLLSSLHRFLGRLQQQDYVPPQIPLYSNAAALTSFQPDFESLSRALTEVLSGVQLPEPLAAMRGRAEADPAGRGPPPGQQAQGTAGGAEQQQQQPEGTGAGAVPRGIGGGGAGAAGRRATVAGSGLVDMTGASYGYRYLPLVSASLAELLGRTQAQLAGPLGGRLAEAAASLRELAAQQAAAQEQQTAVPAEAVVAQRRQLRHLSGHLHAAAGLLADLSRAAIAAATSLNGMPLSLAANSAAAVLPAGDGVQLPVLLPRRAGDQPVDGAHPDHDAGVGGAFEMNFMAPFGPGGMGLGAGGAGLPGMPLGTGAVRIDISEGGLPATLGRSLGDMLAAMAGAIPGAMAGAQAPPQPPQPPQQQQRQQPPQQGPRAAGGPGAGAGAPGAGAGAGGQGRETPLSLLMPMLTAVAGSIAAAVMQSLQQRLVQPDMLFNELARAISQHFTHVIDVISSRWDALSRAADRQRRRAAAAAAAQPAEAAQQQGGAEGEQPAAAEPRAQAADPLDELRPVAARINALFPTWEAVMRVPAEPVEGEEEEESEGEEEGGEEREGRSRRRRSGAGGQDATADAEEEESGDDDDDDDEGEEEEEEGEGGVEEQMNAMMRLLMPSMVDNVARSVASDVMVPVQPLVVATGQLTGQRLAMMVLNALASRLEVVATMVLSNWSHVSQGLEQINSITQGRGGTAMDAMSQMVNMIGSLVGPRGAPAQPPAPAPAPAAAAATPAAPPAAAAPGPAPPAPASAAPAASTAPAARSAPAAQTTPAAAPAPNPPPEAAAAPTADAPSSAAAGAAAGSGPSASAPGPRGLGLGGLGLKPPAPKKKPATAPSVAAGTVAASGPAEGTAAAAPSSAATGAPAAAAAGDAPAASSPGASSRAPAAQEAQRSAGGQLAAVAGSGAAAGGLEGAGEFGGALMDLMGQMMGGMAPPQGGARGAAGGGGGPPGGGLAGLMSMAQGILSDPNMAPMIEGVAGALLGGGGPGGGGGARGGAGGGLGSLLGGLLGGLPPPGGASGGSRSMGTRSAPVGYDVLNEVLGEEEGARWRAVIEADVEAMQQHVQAAPEATSSNYRRGVPARRAGLMSVLGGEAGEGEGEEVEEDSEGDEEMHDAEDGTAAERAG